MKRIYTVLALLLFQVNSFSQNDLIIINGKNIRCTLTETSLDHFKYVLNDSVFEITDNEKMYDFTGAEIIRTVDHLQFSTDSGQVYTTKDLMGRLDFSSDSPHLSYGKDFNTKQTYYIGIDTSNNKLKWYGIDFSNSVFQLGKATRNEYSKSFMLDCNDYFLKENKFEEFRKSFNFIIDTGMVINRINRFEPVYNKKIQPLSIENIRKIIKNFPVGNGVGLVIFVTEFNKEYDTETFYVTFFDIQSKSILLCLKETCSARGVGMAWHWTNGIYDYLMNLLKKSKWKKKYL